MKRFLSSLLCAVLLLGLLPAVSPPARMITGSCSVNRTEAFIGDTLTWSASVTSGDIGPIYYRFYTYRNDWPYPYDDGLYVQSDPQYSHATTAPGRYYARVGLFNYGDAYGEYVYAYSAWTDVYLPAPKISKVEPLSGTSLKITWGKVPGATGYYLERSTSKTTGYSQIKATTATSFTDRYLKPGTRYYYRLRTYTFINTADWTSSKYGNPVAGVPLAKSAILSAAGVSRTQIKLTWKKVTGATGYQIFRSTTAGGTYKSIKLTTALTYTAGGMLHAKTYYFKVRPYKQFGTVKYYGPLSGYRSGRTR